VQSQVETAAKTHFRVETLAKTPGDLGGNGEGEDASITSGGRCVCVLVWERGGGRVSVIMKCIYVCGCGCGCGCGCRCGCVHILIGMCINAVCNIHIYIYLCVCVCVCLCVCICIHIYIL